MSPAATPSPDPAGVGPFRALIVDWGGVMTNPVAEAIRVWCDAEDVDPDHYAAVMRPWMAAPPDTAALASSGDAGWADAVNPVHALERGECAEADFELALAGRLARRDGAPLAGAGLLGRMFDAFVLCDPMHAAVRTVRAAGLRTGLLSNSWGLASYPRHLFPAMFDTVVLSAEVGMRKPEERIFRHAADTLGLSPAACVFVDDVPVNVAAAELVGMTAVLHEAPGRTVARLREVLALPLPGAGDGALG